MEHRFTAQSTKKVSPSDAKAGEFQDSLELIAKSLTETVNQIQDFVEGGKNA
ncbi:MULTISPECIES: hypothetical protein [unclassified Mannheimia]|uniref:hypothetical protein n=1 Tax=unclassified Mannheimia TaxID=2645054 RepID=UPI00359E8996